MEQLKLDLDFNLTPIISAKQIEMKIINSEWIDQYIADRHYLGSTPPGSRLRLAFFHEGVFVGGMLWGRPAARAYEPFQILELTRMYLDDTCPRNSESRCIGLATKLIIKLFPGVHTLLSYSDPVYGHTGTIYRATGWSYSGDTIGKAWTNWKGVLRNNISTSKKARWMKELNK
jgi:hypothetical protein